MTAETAVEKRLKTGVEELGGRCLKLPASLYRGIPDRLVLLPGARIWFIELKREKGRTTPRVAVHQSAWRIFIQNCGFNYARLSGMSEVEDFLRRMQ